jgi:hypothetical protein
MRNNLFLLFLLFSVNAFAQTGIASKIDHVKVFK